MTPLVFAAVLFGAALHASWNAIVKGGTDKLMTTILVAAASGLVAIAALPFLPRPAPASWPFLAASAVVQVGYFLLVAAAYRATDMSRAYPLMRGLAPALVAAFAAFVLGERLGAIAWAGVALISAGVFGVIMAFVIEMLTDYYVSLHKKPVQETSGVATAGPAPMIINGFALAQESSVFSVFAIVVALIVPLQLFD